ncbi:MAG: cell wall hydrolase [Novosphingobium sp.]|nr:cell wall hydrolase [Novosphingobium sp.]
MRSKLNWASGIAVAATLLTAMVGIAGSVAVAEAIIPPTAQSEVPTELKSEPVIQPRDSAVEVQEAVGAETATDGEGARQAESLAELVAAQPQPAFLPPELHCLAGAIYFEARGEPLHGQLAVGRVIVERARSERFPRNYCGVVYQPSQFSFARGDRMPTIRYGSKAWRHAVAIAQIADSGSWKSPVEGAMFFHATHVSPGWRLRRLAQVGNHVFYR